MTTLQALDSTYSKTKVDLYYSFHALLGAITGYKTNLMLKDMHHEISS